MNWPSRWSRKRNRESQLDSELRFHIEQRTEELIADGVEASEARRRAMIEFGGIESAKEECREARGTYFVEGVVQDIRYGVRTLRKSPAFAAGAILTLALGIGTSTGLFSIADAVLINPLPYTHPDRLVAIYARTKISRRFPVSYPNFLDWARENKAFSAMAAFRSGQFVLTGTGVPEHVRVEMVSAEFLPLLGVAPVIGRQFTPEEDRLGGKPVALISNGFWKQKFGGAPNVVGKSLTLNDEVYTIAGVVPAGFRYWSGNFRRNVDLYVPIGQLDNPLFRDRSAEMETDAVGRLKPGVTLAQAQAEMNAIATHLAEQHPNADKGIGITLVPLRQDIVGNIQPILLLVLAAAGFVLLIACANVANLLLARSAGRAKEFAVRAAVGAGRGRVFRQLLTENVILSVASSAVGLGFAACGTRAALSFLPETLPRASEVHFDGHVLFFTVAACLACAVVFGFAPAMKTARADIHEVLKKAGRGSSGTRHHTQRVFVAVEMALAVVLLAGAGVMIRSLARLWSVNPGFDPHRVLTFVVSSPQPLGSTPSKVRAAERQIRLQLGAVPGIEAASLVGSLPIQGRSLLSFWMAGEPKPATGAQMKTAIFYLVQPDYFKVMRIPLMRGRLLASEDNARSPQVVVIDQQFAREYFGRQNPIGRKIHLYIIGASPEIVGVVGHVKQWGLASDSQSPVQAQMYFPISQMPDNLTGGGSVWEAVARTRGSSMSAVVAIRRHLARLDTQLAAYDFQSMDAILSDSLAERRFAMMLLSVFSGFAVLLACVGIYGVTSHVVGERTHEIGIRVALGAQRGDVLRTVIRDGIFMAGIGIVAGICGALAFTRLLSSLLFQIAPTDPATYSAVTVILATVALLASYIPARRATRVDPVVALRQE